MTKLKALIFRIVGITLAVAAVVLATVSFDAQGVYAPIAFGVSIAALVFLKVANKFNRTFFGSLFFLSAFIVMIYAVVATCLFVACSGLI